MKITVRKVMPKTITLKSYRSKDYERILSLFNVYLEKEGINIGQFVSENNLSSIEMTMFEKNIMHPYRKLTVLVFIKILKGMGKKAHFVFEDRKYDLSNLRAIPSKIYKTMENSHPRFLFVRYKDSSLIFEDEKLG